jgi:hypothetical protein
MGAALLASVHDAVIVRERLTVDQREQIVATVHLATGNPYWRLTEKRLKRFRAASEEGKR